MKKILAWVILVIVGFSLNAQFQDDFNDLSFPVDPDWFGDTDIYVVNGMSELQLMDTAAGESFIYVLAPTIDSTTWEFYFRLEFAPSTDNFLKVYLKSDSPGFDGSLHGYYLQIGLAGSMDSIQLRRQDNTSSTLILGGVSSGVANTPGVRVKVIRGENANWQLYTDYSGGNNFQLEGTVNDPTYNEGSYFGFKCKYGVTRKDKFFFDDVMIGPLVQDETPPMLLNVFAEDANTVVAQFNEPLDITSAESLANYTINNGVSINNAVLDTDPSVVILNVSSLTSGENYLLTVENISDVNMNLLVEEQADFTFYLIETAVPFDILVNELFPNPDPEISALPDAEFIELFNRSDKAINLSGFEIFDASNVKVLSDYILLPQSYLIICDVNEVDTFSSFGSVLGVPGLFALNDSGDDLGLRDNTGVEIHKISYTTATYQDEEKNDGGWTLELVNPNLYCQGEPNWRASVDPNGGTPGQENSLFNDIQDLTPPVLLDVIALGENQLRLFFNETMSEFSEDILSYSISNTGQVIDAELEEGLNTVLLTIEAPYFVDQGNYTLSINDGVADCSGNNIVALNFEFMFLLAQPAERYDILINEFYPDFSPTFGLPEKEFVELYNRSNKTINLEGYVINNGTENVELPFFLLQPDAYVILYQGGGLGYNALGDTIVVSNFISLGNEGDAFGLLDPDGQLIHAVDYDKSWYQDADKTEGGWSIELINPSAPCSFQSNWRASVNPSGGTPGRQNSVFEIMPDNISPELISAFPISTNEVRLIFSKALDEESVNEITNYNVEGLTVDLATLLSPFNVVLLQFAETINPDQIYEVVVKSNLTDCIGNGVGAFDKAKFAIPQNIDVKDVIINEVLYDPVAGGARFVELYNRSNKVFNIGDLHIADRDDDGEDIDNNIEIVIDYLLFPGEYVVLTPVPQNILDLYFVENPNWMIESSLPAYDSNGDAVLIFVPGIFGPIVIDELTYTKNFHNKLLDDEEGVSLERISFSGETQDPNNWQSAAATAGFATPTYLNSQYFENGIATDNIFDIPNTTLSPDGDGFEDFLLINYNTSGGGWVANIQIFDANGRLVKRLIQNVTLSAEGTFKWEGDTDNGTKARIGIYVVWIEVFKSDGEVQHLKKTCVLAGRLD
jgi:lamin tail-like protein